MKLLTAFLVASAMSVTMAGAEEVKSEPSKGEKLKSGLQKGEKIGAFQVVKCAGAAEDGVAEGKELCYRCMLSDRPVVAVFARTADKNLVRLIRRLDKVVAKNEEQEMASFVNLLGEDEKKLSKAAKQLIKRSKAENVAIVVPVESKNGHKDLALNEKADVTILIYKEGVIAVNHAFGPGELNKKSIAKVIKDIGTILQ